MSRLTRRERDDLVPAEVQARLGPGEHPLARATTARGGAVLATEHALYVVSGGVQVHPWHTLTGITWEEPRLTLLTREGPFPVELADEGHLPEVARERVRASIVVSEHVAAYDDGRGARFSARRTLPAGDPVWVVTFDAGLDPADPENRAWADRVVERLREAYGV